MTYPLMAVGTVRAYITTLLILTQACKISAGIQHFMRVYPLSTPISTGH